MNDSSFDDNNLNNKAKIIVGKNYKSHINAVFQQNNPVPILSPFPLMHVNNH